MEDPAYKIDLAQREQEHRGSIWKHPYMVYVVLTMLLFAVLLVAGWLAIRNDWLPRTGL